MCIVTFKLTTAVLLFLIVIFARSTTTDRTSLGGSYSGSHEFRGQLRIIAFPGSFERSDTRQIHHRDQYRNFQHNDDFNPLDREYEYETIDDSSKRYSHHITGKRQSIPLDLARNMNNFTDLNDLLLNFVDGVEEEPNLESRFSSGERNAAIVPKPAACMPELQTVKIAEEDDPSVLYIPSCTRVERCGGCCSHNLFSCQPTDLETVSFQVVKTQFMGGSKLKYMGKEVKLVEKHTKCKCDCKIKERDCHRLQQYRKSECRCICVNSDEEKKCYKENATKLWDPDICACQCRNILQCSTGYTFDMLSCKCIPIPVRRRFAELEAEDGFDYEAETLPIVPSNDARNIRT